MDPSAEQLPADLAAEHAMILAERAARLAAEARLAEAANAQAKQSSTEALIAHLKLEIEKLRRTLYGASSGRSSRLLDQLELELEELEAAATEDELAAERRQKRLRGCVRLSASGRCANPSPTTLSASAWSCRLRRNVPAAGRRGCRSSANA